MRAATKDDWQNLQPLHDETVSLPLSLHLDEQQMRWLRLGFIPPEMEYKWFIYFDDNTLHVHRSWSGYKMAEVYFAQDEHGWVATAMRLALDRKQFGGTADEGRASVLRQIAFCASGEAYQCYDDDLLTAPDQYEAPPAPGPAIHPRRDHHGHIVKLAHPDTPTPQAQWHQAAQIARWIPDGTVPPPLYGTGFSSWADHPRSAEDWQAAACDKPGLDLQPLHVPAGKKAAAGAVIVEPDGRVWVVHPSNQFGGYQATFPKGRTDARLSLQATARKEAFEESGLRIEITGLLGDFQRTTTVTRLYLARRIGGTPADMGWESQAVSLVPLAALPSLLNGAADIPVIAALTAAMAG